MQDGTRPRLTVDPQFSAMVVNTTGYGALLGAVFGAYSMADDFVCRRWPPTMVTTGVIDSFRPKALLEAPAWPEKAAARMRVAAGGVLAATKMAAGLTLTYSVVASGVQSIRGGDWDGLDAALGTAAAGFFSQDPAVSVRSRLTVGLTIGAVVGGAKTLAFVRSGRLQWNGPRVRS